ncbi:rap1 GTPase-GDP dissociation stimulator 1-like [Callorhinchus milii]|uniref:rap1 GTPase-GDP dissociation stimulator 1-like n=1 Tax=Callorhinchus milii TaxID=7868 RepID=UPI001C3FC012|nr:rap1 GTPase-GDP dissociation stimulator 1-like [Callorhinchus milii]
MEQEFAPGKAVSQAVVDSDVLPSLSTLLTWSPTYRSKAANVIAELAKNDEVRQPCIDAQLVPALVLLLDSTEQEVLLHAGRAIGRICFENRELQEELVSMGVITSLVKIMSESSTNEALVNVCLLALGNLSDIEEAKEQLCKTLVAPELVKVLRRARTHDRQETVLEVLALLSENDVLKMQLVGAGLHEALADLVQTLMDSPRGEDRSNLKAASDLIVHLLLGDESMQKLFDNGSGVVYRTVVSWLQTSNNQLQLAGALAVANFARNDGNCVGMVALGVVHHLLDLLEQHLDNGNATVQHAALSALRNLAIPVANKVRMLEEGVVERVQSLLTSDRPPVQFKLLGTLRMLVDGQAEAADLLGQERGLLQRLVQWCEAKDHAGVRGEANRLLASLIRHSKSQDVVGAVVQSGGVKHLISMAISEHVIMQNEALIALALASALNLDAVAGVYLEAGLVPALQQLLESEVSAEEVKYNSMALLCSLTNSGDLRQQIDDKNVKESLERLCEHTNPRVSEQACLALQVLCGGS